MPVAVVASSGGSRRCAAPGLASDGLPRASTLTDSSRTLLDLFLLGKAAYEVNYEAANRPSWLPVALEGLAALAARLLAQPVKS